MLLEVSREDIREWLEDLEKSNEKLPSHLRALKFDEKEYYANLSEKELDREVDRDLELTLCLNLHELKSMVNYDLKVDRDESNITFWKFIGNPLYRMHEKTITGKCRDSERYRKKLFDKMATLIDQFRSDKKSIDKKMIL